MKAKFKKSVFWVGGDFNLPDINWGKGEISGHRNLKEINQTFLDTFSDTGLRQIVDEPTRGENILDLFLTNCPDLIKSKTITPGLGDHEAVKIDCSMRLTRKKPTPHTIRLWKLADIIHLKRDVLNFAKSFIQDFKTDDDPDTLWDCIQKNLTTAMNAHVPSKTTSRKIHQPWITTLTKRLLRQKQRWLQIAKRTNSDKNWRRYKDLKKLSQKTCRKAHLDYVLDLISDDKDNKKLWSYIRSKRTDNTGISDLKQGETLIQNPLTKANMFNTFFSQVFSTPSTTVHVDLNPKHPMPKIHITKAGVLKLLLNIKENKATGPDGIPGNLLKICANELADVLTLLFQASLDQGRLPQAWKQAFIVPVFKKGDRGRVENYRPISLTSVTSKLLEHIVHSNIMDHFEEHSSLNEFQHGFRQKRSCETQLLTTVRDFSLCLNRKEQTDAVLLDFSKAFDKVDHEKLLHKLSSLGIGGPLLQWIRSFLSHREQSVLVDGATSSPAPVLSGVPQGTVLGPLLFLTYINDINKNLSEGTRIRLFADDSLLYRTIHTKEDSLTLQKDLNTLQTWEKENLMEFHPGKCQVLRITNKDFPILADYNIHNVPLSHVDSAKYLGVTIDSNLNWKANCNSVCSKANSTLAFLQRNLQGCPESVKAKCFNTFVRPTLEYGCSVWDPHLKNQIESLEKVQKRAARFVTGNYTLEEGNTKKNMNSLEWPPLSERRARTRLTTFYKARSRSIEIPLVDLINADTHISTRYNKGKYNYVRPNSEVDSHFYSFFPYTIKLWNDLPQETKACETVADFKVSLEKQTLRASYN